MIEEVKNCRICKSDKLKIFLPLGNIPLPNGFLKQEQLNEPEAYYPLNTCICKACGLVQLKEIVSPEIMFKNYVYIPSASKTRMQNFALIAKSAISEYKLNSDSLVIDIGSNDGSMLSFFKGYGIKTLGIDPAENLAKIAELKGIETLNDFVSVKLARKIIQTKGKAKVITATNVVAHINNLYDLFEAVEILLVEDGVFICEFPYLLDLIQNNQFDTIYHEHLSYFSIKPLLKLLERVNLQLVNVARTPIDGGSLRVFLSKNNQRKINPLVNKLIETEENAQLYDLSKLRAFAKEVKILRKKLITNLKKLKKQGKTIAAYGAAAKGNILLNYCHITHSLIDFAVDSTPYKQGLYTPGTHIPIFPEIELLNRKPDYTLILAWNFAKEIMEKQKTYRQLGGKFIIPVPKVSIL